MHHFFVDKENIKGEYIHIVGNDVNHIKNVLRMKEGEEILISNSVDVDYNCVIETVSDVEIIAKISEELKGGNELGTEIYLFQCLPKADKMELIIQKSVELGVYKIIPVSSKRSIVKLDEKKSENKIKRWNLISESAAKQSKRVMIPEVSSVMSFKEAVNYAKNLDFSIIPYENFKDMESTKKVVSKIKNGMKIGVFIGPEGGFDESEIEYASDFEKISLGKRILRTETAGLTILSVLMFKLEEGI